MTVGLAASAAVAGITVMFRCSGGDWTKISAEAPAKNPVARCSSAVKLVVFTAKRPLGKLTVKHSDVGIFNFGSAGMYSVRLKVLCQTAPGLIEMKAASVSWP